MKTNMTDVDGVGGFLQYQDPLNAINEISSVYRGLHDLQGTIAKKMTKKMQKKIGKSLTLLIKLSKTSLWPLSR